MKHQLDLSSQVTMFPSNGKEQWNQLMNRMKVIHDQKESLQEKLDAYKPVKKEEIIPWMGVENELEKLYVDLGQWRQTLSDAENMERKSRLAHGFRQSGLFPSPLGPPFKFGQTLRQRGLGRRTPPCR